MTSKKRVKAVTIVCGTVAIGMWADAATAQSAPAPVAAEQDKESAPEILVTANRVQERQRDVALSVTALGGDTLAERRALTFEDYSALVPGLSLQSRGAGNTRVTLRGQNSGGSGSTVAIYIDESPIGSSTSLVQGAVATADLDPFDLQRVEVLRGPQGTLYGANAEGGVIKFVTNDPSFDRIAAAGQVSGFNVNKGQSDYGVRGWLNLPIVDDRVGLRVSAFREGVPGYVDNNYLNINDVNSGERYGFRGTLLVKPVDGLTIRLSALSQKSVIGGQPLEDLRTQTQPFTTDLTQTRYTRELQSSLVKNYSAIVAYDFGKVKLSSITSYGQITQQVNNDLGFSEIAPGFTYRDFVTGYYGQPATLKVAAVNSLDKLSQEFRISATIGRLDLQTGFFYTAEDGQVSQFANGIYLSDQSVAPGALAFGAYVNSHYKEYAGYGTATFHFTPNLDLAAGIRYARNDQNAATITLTSIFGGPGSTINYGSSDDAVTWSVAPRWRISPDHLLYARVATGYRPGGPNTPVPGAPPGFPTQYGSDRTTSYEGGYRGDFFNKRLLVDIDYYHVDWTSIQIPQVFQTLFSYTGNGGEAQVDGVEATVDIRPFKGLTTQLSGAYTDARLTKDAPGAGGVTGDRLPYVPDFTGTVDGDYRWSLGGDWQAFVGGTVSYVGKRYTLFAAAPSTRTLLNDYVTLALRAGLNYSRFSLEVYARNITDERAITQYFSGNPGTGTVIQPRTVGISFTAKY